jgi:hypothetical protein
VKTSRKTYPAVEINEAIYSATSGVDITLALLCIGFWGFIPPSRVNALLFVSLGTASLRVFWNLKRAGDAFTSLRNGLLNDVDPDHLYLRIQRYAERLRDAYDKIRDARDLGKEDVEELERNARQAQAEFWTFVNTLRANVVLKTAAPADVRVLYGSSFKDYLTPVKEHRWTRFEVPVGPDHPFVRSC